MDREIKIRITIQNILSGTMTTVHKNVDDLFGHVFNSDFGIGCGWVIIGKGLCTGRIDRNGKEIYEGDIVRILYTDWPSNTNPDISLEDYKRSISSFGHIVYNAPEFEIYSPAHNQHGSMLPGTHGEIEVIGNMYLDKELLKI